MRISYNWLNSIIALNKSPEQISDILTSLGLEVEGIDYVESIQGGLKGVIVGEILDCRPHPNADRLKLTTVNLGAGSPVQIVCGASNVALGQKVLVATEGAILYPKNGESFTIKKSKIRGEESCGMICAEDELGLSDNHDGIMILDSQTIPGTAAAEILHLQTEAVFEIGLTPNRSDATSHLGVARDLAAWYKVHENVDKKIIIDSNSTIKDNDKINFKVEVIREDLCPRYGGVCISNIKVGPSPDWLQKKLLLMDQKPINNIVDITNYILFHYGQPLHAFDLIKIPDHKLVINTLDEGTKFICLDGSEKNLLATDLMICDTNLNPLCMGGVMGGKDSGVSDSTTSIFLESAYFKSSSIRKSSMHHILRSNAAKLFEKGADPNMCMIALEAAIILISEIAGGEVSSNLIDHYPKKILPSEMNLSLTQVNSLTGMKLSEEKLKEVLIGLNMEFIDLRNEHFTIFVPTNKPDVTRAADVVEEICRVYGLDHIPIPDKIQISFPAQVNSLHNLRMNISNFLSSRGLNEIMNLSLCSSELCIQSGIWKEEELVFINNTSNANLDVLIPSLSIAGLQSIAFNNNRQQQDLACYEFGKEYHRNGEDYNETQKLAIFLSGNKTSSNWRTTKSISYDFYDIKSEIEGLLKYYGLDYVKAKSLEADTIFEYSIEWKLGSDVIAKCGTLNKNLSKLLDIKKSVFYAEVDLALFQKYWNNQKNIYKEVSRFPSSRRDLAVVVAKNRNYSEIETIVTKAASKYLKEVSLFDIYINEEQLGAENKSLALSLLFESNEKSLSSTDLDQEMNKIMNSLESQIQAKIRS